MKRRIYVVLAGVITLLLFSPKLGLASWFDWETEGSYVHQISHLLFLGAMLFFIYEMRRGGLQKSRGFRYLIWTCWLLALWNLDAVVGHAVDWSLRNPLILGKGLSQRLYMENLQTWVYYLTKLDHFIFLVPAFYLFYRGLRAFAQEPRPERQ
ncbi:MAG: hypothetical protein AB1491_10300 [Thermodesulfobacteriota bacterium]